MQIRTSLIICSLIGSLLCMSFSLSLAEIQSAVCRTCEFDDWQTSDDPNQICGGFYRQAPTPPYDQDDPTLHISSHRADFEAELSSFEGTVNIQQGYRQILSDQIWVLRKNNTLHAIKMSDSITMTEPGLRLDASKGLLLVQENKFFLENAYFRLYEKHARGSAKQAIAMNRTQLHLENADYTTCAPSQNFWKLSAKSVDLDREKGHGVARHAYLSIYKVPVFYMPYWNFPIDRRRKTGFLYPMPSFNKRSGFGLAVPFYWNIAPNYDATFTPRTLSKRGTELQTQFRYLFLNHTGDLKYHILPQDRAYRNFRAEKQQNHPGIADNDPRVLGLQKGNTRYGLRFNHQYYFVPNWSGEIHFNQVSDDNYFSDLGENLNTANTTKLLQSAQLNYRDLDWDVTTLVQRYKPLFPFEGPIGSETYRLMPKIHFQYHPEDFSNGLVFSTKGEFTQFQHAAPSSSITTGNRFLLRPALGWPTVTPGYYIKPRAQLNMLAYDLQLSNADRDLQKPKHIHHATPLFDLDSGLVFERPTHFYSKSYTQTLEPRVYYLRVPHKNQNQLPVFDTGETSFDFNQLFRDNRFSGYDRLGDANQTTLGLTSRLFGSKTGIERLRISIGQIFYFRSRKVTITPAQRQRKHSDYALEAMYHMHDHWRGHWGLQWDPYDKKVQKNALLAQYLPNDYDVFNIGYQYLRATQTSPTPSHQGHFSVAKRMGVKWRLLGKYHHNLKRNLAQSTWLGFEYNSCCGALRFMVSRFLQPGANLNQKRYETSFHLQIILKGLASVGAQGIDSELQQAIPGYRWRERFSGI